MSVFQQTLSGDLTISQGRLLLVKEPVSECAHKIRNVLLLFQGEWFLDTRLGVPWYQVVLHKNPDMGVVRRMLSSVIFNASPLISEIERLELTQLPNRTLDVVFEVRITSGELISGSMVGDIFIDGVAVFDPLPFFVSITTAPSAGGTVTVTGSNFTLDAVVKTDGAARATTFVNSTTLTAVVPAHAAGTVSVEVTQASGSTGVQPTALTYLAPAPAFGSASVVPLAGGTLYIYGTNFVGTPVVKTDGVSRTVSAATSTKITVTGLPAHAAGTVSLEVINPDLQTTGVLGTAVEYFTPYTATTYNFVADSRDYQPTGTPYYKVGRYLYDHQLDTRALYANGAATTWSPVGVNGVSFVLAPAQNNGDNSSALLYDASGGSSLTLSELFGVAGSNISWTATIVGTFPAGKVGGTDPIAATGLLGERAIVNENYRLGISFSKYHPTTPVDRLWVTWYDYALTGGSWAQAAIPATPGVLCIIQIRFTYNAGTPLASTLELRINDGAWSTPVAVPPPDLASYGGQAIAALFTFNGSQTGWPGNLGWMAFAQGALSNANANKHIQWAASEFGVAL